MGSEDVVEVVGDVAAEAAKEEGWELAKERVRTGCLDPGA